MKGLREQVIDYVHANDVNDALAQTEADRYITWPGQALTAVVATAL